MKRETRFEKPETASATLPIEALTSPKTCENESSRFGALSHAASVHYDAEGDHRAKALFYSHADAALKRRSST